jgi:3-deoxy-D-manno-octulosonic-acid transferase
MALYNLIMTLIVVGLKLRHYLAPHKGNDTLRENERFTPPGQRPARAPLIWVHGASNGELTATKSLLANILERAPDCQLVITTNSLTARDMVTGWALPRTVARLAPVDQRAVTAAFLDALRPSALVILENELWPNRLSLCAARKIPVLVLGARMSARSASLWQRFPGIGRKLMSAINWLAPQDEASRERFLSLGLAKDKMGPTVTLKSAVKAERQPTDLPYERDRTILAASTHEREEGVVIDAFRRLIDEGHADLHLILAPRHPRRRDEIEALTEARSLTFATRSRGQEPEKGVQVYLADTMGEMPRWYAAAAITFVGGSLTDRGGHTPFEPAAYGSAIIHGPDVANFAAAYAALSAAGAAVEISDAPTLRQAFSDLLLDPARRQDMTQNAARVLTPTDDETGLANFLTALGSLAGLHLRSRQPYTRS